MSPCPQLWFLSLLLYPCRAVPCPLGELRPLWGGGTKCCPRCTWDTVPPLPCPAVPDPDCKCPRGFGCSDEPCQYCQRVPSCEPGWETHRIGRVNFQFECRRCANGSYSSSRDSRCRNWTDCESSGFLTLREGNSTHNSICSIPGRAPETAGISLEFPSGIVLAILTAVAVFVLILLTFLLHFCLWNLRKDPKFPTGDLGSRPPGEEFQSIQFPEEEHGEKWERDPGLEIYSELG